jgi:peptide/nickel transport system substrate-binding protein
MNERSRRAKLLGAVFSLALAATAGASHAETPANALIVAQSIDDAVSFDPAEGFELTTVQSFNNLYQRLIQSDRNDGTKIEPALAASWEAGTDGKSLTFTLIRQIRFASGNAGSSGRRDLLADPRRKAQQVAGLHPERTWLDSRERRQGRRKDRRHTCQTHLDADVGPAFALSLLTAPIASVVDEKTVSAEAKDGDFGNGWLKINSAGSGAFKIATYTPHEALVLQANPMRPTSRSSKTSSCATCPTSARAGC